MANTLITPSIIAKEGLFHLENNLIMAQQVHREYKHEFVKVGNTVSIRKPVKFLAKDGATRQNQDVIETSTNITIDKRKHVSWKFSTQDLTLTVDEYSERYIKPAMIALANKVDVDLCTEGARKFFHRVGTPGTTPDGFQAVSDVSERMDEASIPDDGMRRLIVNPAARWKMANGMQSIYNAEIVGGAFRKGRLGNIAGLEIYGTQNIHRHTTGDHGGTPLVNNASFSNDTNTVAIDGASTSTTGYLKAGDVFTIAGVNRVNDVSKEDSGELQQFVVLEDADTNGSGEVSVTVYPTLNDGSTSSTAAYQTVSDLPADNAAITVVGTADTPYPQNLGFHRNALALVTCPLELPDSAVFKARANWRGLSIRVVKAYDIEEDEEVIRMDILYGVDAIYPELGVRLDG